MISSRALMGILTISLLVPGTAQAMQPVDLDDSVGTFSSINIAAQQVNTKRQFAPYLAGGFASLLLGTLGGAHAASIYYYNSSLPWWEAEDKAMGLASTIRTATLLGGLYLTHRAVESVRETRTQLARIQEKTRKIVGDSSFLDAIKTDNVDHMRAWIECDTFFANNHNHIKSLFVEFEKDTNGRTPIMLAVLARSTKVLPLLLEYYEEKIGSCVHWEDNQGNTALHLAAELGNHETVQLLLNYGADASIINDAGKTPAQMADPLNALIWQTFQDLAAPDAPKAQEQPTVLKKTQRPEWHYLAAATAGAVFFAATVGYIFGQYCAR